MSVQSTQVKAILLRDGLENGRKEIRRFRVDHEDGMGMGGRFQSLLAHIHSVFNVDTATLHCSLFWKDEDDDLVQFSTDEELQHAGNSMNDDTLRIFIIVTPRVQEDSSGRPRAEPGTGFQPPQPPHCPWQFPGPFHAPPPPPPPPPPFLGPCVRKKWKHMGRCGWKGGWKGGLDFGWPGFGGHDWHWKGKGDFKRCPWKMKRQMKAAKQQNDKEFQTVRQQVPGEFRSWVRQFIHIWYRQGAEAALTTVGDKLPKDTGPDFPKWLLAYLNNSRPGSYTASSGGQAGDIGMETQREMGTAPEGVPPVYLRWLHLFVTRFFWRQGNGAASDFVEDDSSRGPKGLFGRFCHGRRGFGRRGKHGRHGRRGGRHGGSSSSSDSEDSDSGEKAWQNIPKGFRKFVRQSMKQLHKKKKDNPKIKAKALQAGISPTVQEFVNQILLEWHAKLSRQPPRRVAEEMMEGERTLPSGLEREHFLWLCRFMVRWHCRHAGKCDMMSSWSSGDTTTDDSSDSDAPPPGQDCGPRPPFHHHHHHHPPPPPPHYGAAFMERHGPPPGMMGYPQFGMHPGMNHPCPPPPPPMFDSWCTPPPAYTCGSSGDLSSDQTMDCEGSRNQGPPEQDKSTGRRTSKDDMVEHVTEGVKRL